MMATVNSDAWAVTRHCNSKCDGYAPYCGDEMPSAEETCDMGEGVNSNDYAGTSQICDLSCQGFAPHCGDGDITDDEVCDDGNNDDGDRCAADCSRIKPSAAMVSLRGMRSATMAPP